MYDTLYNLYSTEYKSSVTNQQFYLRKGIEKIPIFETAYYDRIDVELLFLLLFTFITTTQNTHL